VHRDIGKGGLACSKRKRAVEYSAYSLTKGQRMHDAVHILLDLFARRLYR
jgi:hypothetical protein